MVGAQGRDQADISEALIAALRPDSIEIKLPLVYLSR